MDPSEAVPLDVEPPPVADTEDAGSRAQSAKRELSIFFP